MKFNVFFPLVLLVVFVAGISHAHLPAQLSEDDHRLARFLKGVDKIYIYSDGNSGFFPSEDAGNDSYNYSHVSSRTHQLADERIQALFSGGQSSLLNIGSGNVIYNRPDPSHDLENVLVITYARSLSKTAIGTGEGILGTMNFSLHLYPAKTCDLDDSCVENTKIEMPAIPFVVAESLDFEYTSPPDPSTLKEYERAMYSNIEGELIMNKLHPSYETSIDSAVSNLHRFFDRYAKIYLNQMGKK